jgi:predicted aldo/keto reductase-like oxidoreductase
VGTTLRYLMYHDTYRDPETARALYARLPEEARRIEGVDFTEAAALCPHRIDIAKHMRRAAHVLA